MPIDPRFSVAVPSCSIQQWMFGSSNGPLPETKAWIDAERPETHFLTLAGARLLAKRIAVGLRDNGLGRGDRVLLFSGNSIFFPAVVLGIWMAGGVFTGANHGYTARELAFQLQDTEASFMIAADSMLDTALKAASQVGLCPDSVFVFDSTLPDSANVEIPARDGTRHWTELVASRVRGDEFEWEEPEDSREVTCAINYSSGTTGFPKGVEVSHYNHVANGLGIIRFNKLRPDYEIRTRKAKALCILPMYHAFSQGYFVLYLPVERIPVYVMPSFDFTKMLAHIQAYGITQLFAVPPILVALSKHPLARRANLSSIDMVASGAAPLARDTQREVDGMISSDGTARQGFGMTEATCTTFTWDSTRPSSLAVGELVANCRAKLVDLETGVEFTAANTPGELWIAGPTIMRGYWRNPDATEAALVKDDDGTQWLRTGDVAVVDNYGPGALFRIVDRAKELIKVKGNQVAPAELEALLLERNDIVDAAVVGVVTDGEEVPRAYVVKSPNAAETSESNVCEWIASRVARYKRLRGGVVFVESIPKVPSGKILRKVLRERAQRELGGGGGGEVRAKL